MDWQSHQVGVSHTKGSKLCMVALEMALQSTGQVPNIFKTLISAQLTPLQHDLICKKND